MSLRLVSRLGVRTLECSWRLSSDSDVAGSSLPGRYTKLSWAYLAAMKSLLVGCNGSEDDGLRRRPPPLPLLEPPPGLSSEYSQMELAPHEYRLCTMVSCSGIQCPARRLLTCETCLPSDLCAEVQAAQRRTPRLMDAQVGPCAPQSAQEDNGC